MNLILTGVPGIGKTTVIEKVACSLGDRAGGILTREIREAGRRTGFWIESLDGERRVLATRHQKGGPRVGPYTVIVSNLEQVAIGALERALNEKQVVVIDEIGKMELISERFRDMILKVLEGDVHVIATLGIAKNPFLERIRRRSDVNLVEVTLDSRQSLPGRVLELIQDNT